MAKTIAKATKTDDIPLPAGVIKSDMEYPKTWSDRLKTLELYYTERMGWVITVLPISKGRGNFANRSYGICIKGAGMCSVGNGPHVLRQITLHITKGRAEKLGYLLKLAADGEVRANQIRDNRSSRRAAGAMRRDPFGGLF